jgi:hypothetical protein
VHGISTGIGSTEHEANQHRIPGVSTSELELPQVPSTGESEQATSLSTAPVSPPEGGRQTVPSAPDPPVDSSAADAMGADAPDGADAMRRSSALYDGGVGTGSSAAAGGATGSSVATETAPPSTTEPRRTVFSQAFANQKCTLMVQ